MKQLRSLVLLIALSFLMSSGTIAQRQSPEERVQRMKEQLSLTDDQVLKIKGILDSLQKQMSKDREQQNADREQMRAKARTRMEEADKEIEKILTAEQKKKYEAMKEERRKRMEERMRNRENREQ